MPSLCSRNPNYPEENLPVPWPRFEEGSERFLVLSLGMSKDKSLGENLFEEKVSFWTICLSKVSQGDGDLPPTCPAPKLASLTTIATSDSSSSAIPSVSEVTTVPKSTGTKTTRTLSTATTTAAPPSTVVVSSNQTKASGSPRYPQTDATSDPRTQAPISNLQASTNNPDLATLPCNGTFGQQTRFLDRLGMDADTAETTIIALAAATGAFGLIALIVSCMLCAKKRKRTDYY